MQTNATSPSPSGQPASRQLFRTLINVAIASIIAIGAFLGAHLGGLNIMGQMTIPGVVFGIILIALQYLRSGQHKIEEKKQVNPPVSSETKLTQLKNQLTTEERAFIESYERDIEDTQKRIDENEKEIEGFMKCNGGLEEVYKDVKELPILIKALDSLPQTADITAQREKYSKKYEESQSLIKDIATDDSPRLKQLLDLQEQYAREMQGHVRSYNVWLSQLKTRLSAVTTILEAITAIKLQPAHES